MAFSSRQSPWILLVLLMVGGLVGALIGQALQGVVPALTTGKDLEVGPVSLDLVAFKLQFALVLRFNLASILGFAAGFWVWKRY